MGRPYLIIMPIFRNSTIGNHKNVTLIVVGKGDVDVSEGYINGNEDVPVMYFSNNKGDKIGNEKDLSGTTTNDIDDLPVAIEFTHPESIDVMISQLEKCKERLIGKKK